MRLFIKQVCLSIKQAQQIVNAVYPEHIGAQLQGMPRQRNLIANRLIELLILPVGRAVAYTRDNNAHVFDFDNAEGDTELTMSVPYNETQTARKVALIILTSVTFGQLKYELERQLNYKWHLVKEKEA